MLWPGFSHNNRLMYTDSDRQESTQKTHTVQNQYTTLQMEMKNRKHKIQCGADNVEPFTNFQLVSYSRSYFGQDPHTRVPGLKDYSPVLPCLLEN